MYTREIMVDLALKMLGTPYVWGGNDPDDDGGVDCSGFALYLLHRVGLVKWGEDMTAHDLYKSMPMPEGNIHPDYVDAGDFVFYGTKEKITHVMMALGPGVVIGSIGKEGAVDIRPMNYRPDIVAVRWFE